MIRTCTGDDPTLSRYPHNDKGECPKHNPNGSCSCKPSPCNCGMTFEDDNHMVIYPHAEIPTREERDALLREFMKQDGISVD